MSNPASWLTPGRAIALFGVGILVMLLLVVTAFVKISRSLENPGDLGVPVNLEATLTPGSGSTRVTLRIQPIGDDALPNPIRLQFTPIDQGLNDDGGNPFTDATLEYGQVSDRNGKALPISAPAVTVKNVPTDADGAEITFTVASVSGKRVIFPIPFSKSLRFREITVKGATTSSACLQSGAIDLGRPHYSTCTVDPSGVVNFTDGPWAPEHIRLELAR